MAIYCAVRTISIRSPQIYCDLCKSSTLNLVGDLTDFRLIRSEPRKDRFETIGMSEGVFEIPGMPNDEATAKAVAEASGWKEEVFHGKPLLLCPSCSCQ